MALRSVLLAQAGVIDYLVTQTPRGGAALVVLERDTDLAHLRGRPRAALLRAGLADPHVGVEAVSSLPRHPETGKLRRLIPA